MIYVTQLVYIHEGEEETFHAFEMKALPIIERYNGKLLLRLRPDEGSVIEKNIDTPHEIHIVQFQSENDFIRFTQDGERNTFLHLKKKSVKTVWLMKGEKL